MLTEFLVHINNRLNNFYSHQKIPNITYNSYQFYFLSYIIYSAIRILQQTAFGTNESSQLSKQGKWLEAVERRKTNAGAPNDIFLAVIFFCNLDSFSFFLSLGAIEKCRKKLQQTLKDSHVTQKSLPFLCATIITASLSFIEERN